MVWTNITRIFWIFRSVLPDVPVNHFSFHIAKLCCCTLWYVWLRGGISTGFGCNLEACFANNSAFSLPIMPMWLGTHWNFIILRHGMTKIDGGFLSKTWPSVNRGHEMKTKKHYRKMVWGWPILMPHSLTLPSFQLCHSSFSNPSIASPTSQLIFQPFCCFTYITAHSPTLLLLHLHHSSFSNPSVASLMSQDLNLIHLASHPGPS